MKLHDHDALAAADPARGLEPALDDELRRARVEAILAEPPEAPETAPRPRRRPVRRLALAAGAAAVIATIGGLVLSSDEDSTRLPGTAAAFAEQIQRHEGIVHYVTGAGSFDGKYELDGSSPTEAWVALDGSGWRQRFHEPGGAYRDDTMNERGDQLRYTSKTGRLRSFPAERPLNLEERLGALNAGHFVGELIAGGQLRDDGEATVDGQPARRLVLDGPNRTRYEYFVATDRVRLLRISAVNYNPAHPDAPPARLEIDMRSFEILPDTPANRALIQMPRR
jgi:hypothetical protein